MADLDIETHLLPTQRDVGVKTPRRLIGLDLFRGFIMVLMTWDHLKDILGDVAMHGSETWQGESPDYNNNGWFFLARMVSDLCAPGFFFSMGVGMVYATESKLKKGMSFYSINQYYAKRSLVIFGVGRYLGLSMLGTMVPLSIIFSDGSIPMVNMPGKPLQWPHDWKKIILLSFTADFQVMTALSFSMVFASLLLTGYFMVCKTKRSIEANQLEESKRLVYNGGAIIFAFLCVTVFAISNAVILHFEYGDPRVVRDKFPAYLVAPGNLWGYILRFALIPGVLGGMSKTIYPLIPWVGLTFLGICFGFLFKINQTKAVNLMGMLSPVFATMFVLVRLFGGPFGNLRGFPVGDGSSVFDDESVSPIIEFFYTLKYPPSPAYALLTMSLNFGVIRYFSRQNVSRILDADTESLDYIHKYVQNFLKLLLALGNAPLFFYAIHFPVIALCNVAVTICLGFGTRITLPYVAILWIPVILVLYPCCLWFSKFKQTTAPSSWWRLI